MTANISIITVNWATHQQQLVDIRTQVFMIEQNVSADLEWDGLDAEAMHLLAFNPKGIAIGCARLLSGGSVGRMAVLKGWRGKGVGRLLLNEAIKIHRQHGVSEIKLSAQIHAITFYESAGFEVCSLPYLDANIMHVDMRLS